MGSSRSLVTAGSEVMTRVSTVLPARSGRVASLSPGYIGLFGPVPFSETLNAVRPLGNVFVAVQDHVPVAEAVAVQTTSPFWSLTVTVSPGHAVPVIGVLTLSCGSS